MLAQRLSRLVDTARVTPPRRVVPGQSLMVQRRTMYRMFLLLPTSRTKHIIAYCLGYALSKFSIHVHEFEFLSNHYHLVLTDPLGELPAFLRELNSLIARALNASYGRWEAVWSVEPYCAPVLCDGEDLFDKCVYTLRNANQAGLVRYTKDYEGLCSWSMEYGRPRTISRPDSFFSDDMPEQVSLKITRPPHTRPELSDRELRLEIRRAVQAQDDANARGLKAEGGAFLGMKRVLRQSITDTPSSRAPRRGIRPRVAGRSRWARIEAIQRNKAFQNEYRAAWERMHAGERDVLFPFGTYKLRLECGVSCRPPP